MLMNEYNSILRRRRQNLIIVEGKHEKSIFFKLIFQIFPELDISLDDVWVYGTNIYVLYNNIVLEYGKEWYDEDVDLAYIVGKKLKHHTTLSKYDFTNIFLVFDYERHDPNFSEEKIGNMQRYFNDSTDSGKLYINYPMLESYQHFKCFPDPKYMNLAIDVTLQPGAKYKSLVSNSFMDKLINFPYKIEKILSTKYGIKNINTTRTLVQKILEISNLRKLRKNVSQILFGAIPEPKLYKAISEIEKLLADIDYLYKNMNYYEFMRDNFKQIILHNIYKGRLILDRKPSRKQVSNKYLFESLDLNEILMIQNQVSRDEISGFIWVLNTCVFIIPDYNFNLLENA